MSLSQALNQFAQNLGRYPPDKWVEAKDKERCGEALEEDGSIVDCNINDGGSSSDDVCHGIGRFPTTDNRYRDSADY